MKYLILAYGNREKNEALTDAQLEAIVAQCKVYDEELRRTGALVSAQSLDWTTMCIRPRSGKTITTDGPYIETKEQVGGLVVIEAKDLNEAVRIASLHPAARMGEELGWGIELRPIADGCHR